MFFCTSISLHSPWNPMSWRRAYNAQSSWVSQRGEKGRKIDWARETEGTMLISEYTYCITVSGKSEWNLIKNIVRDDVNADDRIKTAANKPTSTPCDLTDSQIHMIIISVSFLAVSWSFFSSALNFTHFCLSLLFFYVFESNAVSNSARCQMHRRATASAETANRIYSIVYGNDK